MGQDSPAFMANRADNRSTVMINTTDWGGVVVTDAPSLADDVQDVIDQYLGGEPVQVGVVISIRLGPGGGGGGLAVLEGEDERGMLVDAVASWLGVAPAQASLLGISGASSDGGGGRRGLGGGGGRRLLSVLVVTVRIQVEGTEAAEALALKAGDAEGLRAALTSAGIDTTVLGVSASVEPPQGATTTTTQVDGSQGGMLTGGASMASPLQRLSVLCVTVLLWLVTR